MTGQLWSLSTTILQVRLRVQLNSILFAKTLVRKDVASSAPPPTTTESGSTTTPAAATTPVTTNDGSTIKKDAKGEDDFSSKAQIMTLMTTDVDRVSEFSWHIFTLVGMVYFPISHSFVLTIQYSHLLRSSFLFSQIHLWRFSSGRFSCTVSWGSRASSDSPLLVYSYL